MIREDEDVPLAEEVREATTEEEINKPSGIRGEIQRAELYNQSSKVSDFDRSRVKEQERQERKQTKSHCSVQLQLRQWWHEYTL